MEVVAGGGGVNNDLASQPRSLSARLLRSTRTLLHTCHSTMVQRVLETRTSYF